MGPLNERLTGKATRQSLPPGHGGKALNPGSPPIICSVGDLGFACGATSSVALVFTRVLECIGITAASAFHPGKFAG